MVQVKMALHGLCVSVIDATPQELLCASIMGVKLGMTTDDEDSEGVLDLRITRLQIDNQLYSTPFPVALYPRQMASSMRAKKLAAGDDAKREHDGQTPFIHLRVARRFDYESIEFVRKCSLITKPRHFAKRT
jgi:hypothetical protein